jgi:hypothetical protein
MMLPLHNVYASATQAGATNTQNLLAQLQALSGGAAAGAGASKLTVPQPKTLSSGSSCAGSAGAPTAPAPAHDAGAINLALLSLLANSAASFKKGGTGSLLTLPAGGAATQTATTQVTQRGITTLPQLSTFAASQALPALGVAPVATPAAAAGAQQPVASGLSLQQLVTEIQIGQARQMNKEWQQVTMHAHVHGVRVPVSIVAHLTGLTRRFRPQAQLHAQQSQQLQAQQEQLRAQQQLVQQLTQALAMSQASHAQSPSISPVLSHQSSARTSPLPQANGMFIHSEWVSREQLLRIYALRSKQTCGTGPMDQAAAGRSMVVAGIFHLPPKTIRDIWARKIGAEWTCAGWTERERHLHACDGSKSPEGDEERHVGSKSKAGGGTWRAPAEGAKIARKPESDL